MQSVGDEQLTVSTSAVSLTVPAQAQFATIRVMNSRVRMRANAAPTASVGVRLEADEVLEFLPPDTYHNYLSQLEFIRDTTEVADATLDVEYYQP